MSCTQKEVIKPYFFCLLFIGSHSISCLCNYRYIRVALGENLREHLPQNCIGVRFELSWESPWTSADYHYDSGLWEGPPTVQTREIRMNIETVNRNLYKAPTA